MFELRYPPPHLIDDRHIAAVRETIAEVLKMQEQRGNRAGNQLIVDRFGLEARIEKNESYWGEALDYHLGLLYAHIGEPELAALHFDRSGTYPGHGGNQLFHDHQHDSLELHRQQMQAKDRGIPSILLASMPRSASASLTQTLATILGVPLMRVSCGRFPNFYLIPRWVNCFTPGGAVLHDHFGAIPFNLKTLHDCAVRQIFVRVRDPRPAAASWLNLSRRRHGAPVDDNYESGLIAFCEQYFVPWLNGWIAASSDVAAGLKIHWLTQPANVISEMAREVLTVLAPQYPTLEQYLRADVAEVSANFVTGDEEAWRKSIGPRGQERLWNAIPQDVKDFLALQP